MTEERRSTGKSRAPNRVWGTEVSARWYLWDGGFLAVGRGEGVVAPHSHHAFQIVIAIDGQVEVKQSGGEWRSGQGLVVPPDVEHSYDGKGALGAMLFVDPESHEGRWLSTTYGKQITFVPEARLVSPVAELRTLLDRPFESMDIEALIRHCVQAVCTGAPTARRIDGRVTTVLTAIQQSQDLRMSLETAAAMVFLSPGRFAHLFTQQVGLPFRRYILWRKVTRAMLAIGRERTLTAAASAADFADAAHLTRTFHQMFGIAPSALMRGEFFEIGTPFGRLPSDR